MVPMRRHRGFLAASIGVSLAVSTLAVSARAQVLAGAVHDSVDGRPVRGAVLTLLDSSGAMLARSLTNERGEYRVLLPGASRRARVVRIGFAPRELPLPVHGGGDVRLDIRMLSLPNMLQQVRIIANSHCPVRKDGAAATGLWEQARAGLLATVVAREERPSSMRRLTFDRKMDGHSDRITSMTVRGDSSVDTASFVAARSAQDFIRLGFASDPTRYATFFGPDANVLLSESFEAAYCFRIADANRTRPKQVGLRFLPAEHRDGRTDIDGTIWVDTAARELRDVEFLYLGVPARDESFLPGGHIFFHAMPSGAVLIDRWVLRLVNVARDTEYQATSAGNPGFYEYVRDRLFAEEIGGELARAAWPDGFVWKAPLGALRVHAVTATGAPAAGSVIALAGTPYVGTVDSSGTAEIKELLPGPYTAQVVDPRVAALGIALPTPLKFTAFRDSTNSAALRVPTLEEFVSNRCIAAHQWTPAESVFVIGRVVKRDGSGAPNVNVRFASGTSNGIPAERPEFFVTATDGLFQSCRNWHIGDDVTISVDGVTRTFVSNILVVPIKVPR
jgi:Carboxypeptidase regulatory-like domain